MKWTWMVSWVLVGAGLAQAQEASYAAREWGDGRYVVEDLGAGRIYGLIEDLSMAMEAEADESDMSVGPVDTDRGGTFEDLSELTGCVPLGEGTPPALFQPRTGQAWVFGADSVQLLDPVEGRVVIMDLDPAEARQAASWEASAIGAMRTLSTCQALFREGDRDQDGEFNYGTLKALWEAQLVDDVLGSGFKNGYLIFCAPCPEVVEFVWRAYAVPLLPGLRHFATDQTGVVYYRAPGSEPYAFPEGTDADSWSESLGNPVGR